jgi:hypothetical protein
MAKPIIPRNTYFIFVGDRLHLSNLARADVADILAGFQFDVATNLRKLDRQGFVIINDEVGEITIEADHLQRQEGVR